MATTTMLPTIFMIQSKGRDIDNYTTYTLREEYGYFLSEEDAQEFIDQTFGADADKFCIDTIDPGELVA